jgi:hypothetical protein
VNARLTTSMKIVLQMQSADPHLTDLAKEAVSVGSGTLRIHTVNAENPMVIFAGRRSAQTFTSFALTEIV